MTTPLALLLLATALLISLGSTMAHWVALRNGSPLRGLAPFAISTLNLLVGAGVAFAVGHTMVRRLLAAGLVVVTIPLNLAFSFVTTHSTLRPDDIRQFEVLALVQQLIVGLALVAAWGVARRQGPLWWLGLAVLPVLLAVEFALREPVSRVLGDIADVTGEPLLVIGLLSWLWGIWPLLATGLACWFVDQLSHARRAATRL